MQDFVVRKRDQLGEVTEAEFSFRTVSKERAIGAFSYKPSNFYPTMPVVVVMHGVTRDARHYLDCWLRIAERENFLLVVPEFSRAQWRGSRRYSLGNMHTRVGAQNPPSSWSFTALDMLMAKFLPELGSSAEKFAIYGHSAGAQFVHRYIMFTGGARLTAAVAANAGWYTLPSSQISFPYGVGEMPGAHSLLRSAMAVPMTILLGREDICVDDPDLRCSPGAMMQGANRLERGRMFYASAQTYSAGQRLRFNWTLQEIDHAGHNDRHLSQAAVAHIKRVCLSP